MLAACGRDHSAAKPADMVFIPAGNFVMGSDEKDTEGLQKRYGFSRPLFINEHPPHQQYVQAFWMDRFEVTNGDYKKFVQATNHPEPKLWIQNGYNVHDDKLRSAHVDNLRWIASDYFHLDIDTRQMDKPALLKALFDEQRYRDTLPVSAVNWNDANSYCLWPISEPHPRRAPLPIPHDCAATARSSNSRVPESKSARSYMRA